MLQLDMNRNGYSRTPRRPPDFLTKNKRAVKNMKSRAPEKKPFKPPLSNRPHPPQSMVEHVARGGVNRELEGTVTISKAYLEQLLNVRSQVRDDGTGGDRHVDINPSQVPGLKLSLPHSPMMKKELTTSNGRISPLTQGNLQTHDQLHNNILQHVSHGNHHQQQTQQETATYHYPDKSKQESYLYPNQSKQESSYLCPNQSKQESSFHYQDQASDKKKTKRQSQSPEYYFPFGRPGCGAPLRTDSGHVIADLRSFVRGSTNLHTVTTEIPHLATTATDPVARNAIHQGSSEVPKVAVERVGASLKQLQMSGELASPRYARGAGPHINEYVLKEKADKKKKELEHKEYLKAQIVAKEQAKKEAKERAELEARREEVRLAKERERMKEDHQNEIEKARKKEEESRRRQAVLQQAIDEAAEMAMKAKQESKTHRHHRTQRHVTYNRTSPHISNSTFSPSHTSGQHPVTSDLRKTHTVENSSEHLASKFNKTPSMLRLVPSDSTTQASPRLHKTQYQREEETTPKGSRIPIRKRPTGKGGVAASRSKTNINSSKRTAQFPPPLPTLARKMEQHAPSPPVPTLARKMRQRAPSPPVPTLTRKSNNSESSSPLSPLALLASEEAAVPVFRSSSPPVPALARRMRSDTNMDATTSAVTVPTAVPPSLPPSVPTAVQTHDTTHLPPVATATTSDGGGVMESWKPQGRHRQQEILQELAQLRKGILSHRSHLDQNLDSLLHCSNSIKNNFIGT